ncbi:MAG: DUF3021 domain-containing protein [Clostridia bacterium]|nr:DUF3021 domain-containing protein [Clostridia bacterium]
MKRKMNENLKEFLHRGLMFGGFGCVVVGIVLAFVGLKTDLNLAGWQILLAIFSGYMIAFVQAGTTVFHQIEKWSPIKSAGLQLACLYIVYIAAYLVNRWIPLRWQVILIFTGAFTIGYFLIWGIVYLSVSAAAKRLNKQIE